LLCRIVSVCPVLEIQHTSTLHHSILVCLLVIQHSCTCPWIKSLAEMSIMNKQAYRERVINGIVYLLHCLSKCKQNTSINQYLVSPPSALLVMSIEIRHLFPIYQNNHPTVLEKEGFMSTIGEQCTPVLLCIFNRGVFLCFL